MDAEAKRRVIRWRRILFAFHLLLWLTARLVVGSLPSIPPAGVYDNIHWWGILVFGHWLLLAVLDGRDGVELPLGLSRFVEPRERRWSLLTIDAAVWIIFTMAIASRTISLPLIMQFVVPISLAWLGLTAVGIAHVGLVVYAIIHDRMLRKRKNKDMVWTADRLALANDGELIDFPDGSADESGSDAKRKHGR